MHRDNWHARIDDADGGSNGSGLFVGRRQVLTCAHVAKKIATPIVSFPAHESLRDIPAHAVFVGPYKPDSGFGDVAVLELDRDVPLVPAQFARPHALGWRSGARLVSYGFPGPEYGYDRYGVVAEVRGDDGPRIADEWCQLTSWDGHGMRLVGGFSGAAVTFADTGEVVGIVVETDHDESTRLARMLPVDRIAWYWEDLNDALPLGPFEVAAHRELRAMLTNVVLAEAAQAYAEALPDRLLRASLPSSARTAYQVVKFLVESVTYDGDIDTGIRLAVARLCRPLCQRVPALQEWLDRHVPSDAPTPVVAAPKPEYATVIVEVEPSGSDRGANLLTVWRMIGDEVTCPETMTVMARDLRRTVERVVPAVVDSIEPADLRVRVEFVLPRRWLTKPVHEWTAQAEGRVAFGLKYSVVVRDLARFVARTPDRELRRRWALLRENADAPGQHWVWIDCTDRRDRQRLTAWLIGEGGATVVAMPGPPRPPERHAALGAAIAGNVPVALWGGESCPERGACPQPCAGQRWRTAITRELAACQAGDLPEQVLRLRRAAVETGDERHCGWALALLWDDPTRRPAADIRLGLAG